MKVLKDPDKVLQIMNKKMNQLHKKFDEAGCEEASRISGQEIAIICVRGYIQCALNGHRGFNEDDMACVYEYVANKRKAAYECSNPWDIWLMKGRAEGAAWAMREIEKRMEG